MDITVEIIKISITVLLAALFFITLPGLVNQKRYDKDEEKCKNCSISNGTWYEYCNGCKKDNFKGFKEKL